MRLGVSAALVDGELLPGDVEVVDGRIAAVGLAGSIGRAIAAPGFVDLQVNGYAGVDFSAAGRDELRVRPRRPAPRRRHRLPTDLRHRPAR